MAVSGNMGWLQSARRKLGDARDQGDSMKRRILLVDDEVAVLLTLKAVLEISGFDVDTAASGREGKSKLRTREYHMVITDMRMENDAAGVEVIAAARSASYHPAIAMLTAFPVADDDWQTMGADKMLVKPMHTRVLLEQIEKLLASHEAKLSIWSTPAPKSTDAGNASQTPASAKKSSGRKAPAKRKAAKGLSPAVRSTKSKAGGVVAKKSNAKRGEKAVKG
jgi:DNA-binding response OmpR family regulator